MNRPNILYIHSHDTGRYIQPYGQAVPTPNLQRLAETGVLFRGNFCVAPTCSPSRASLLTGCYPHENGMLGLAHRGFSLNDYHQHIIHRLHEIGYTSVIAGGEHIAHEEGGKKPWEITGYQRCLCETKQEQEVTAVDFLNNDPPQPFFLSVGFFETHREYPKPEEIKDNPDYCSPPPHLPDAPETRMDMARFKASARILDKKMGSVFDALERNGLAENTLVICTTDHGIAFPRMKCSLFDTGIGTMLIMRGPGGFTGGRVVDAMTTHMDIYPTICQLLDIEEPKWLRGKSLLPLVNGEVSELHDAIIGEINYHAAYEPMRSIRTKRWKYIRRFDGRKRVVLPNCDDGESKSYLMEHGWREREIDTEILCDLVYDPCETNNLAKDARFSNVLGEMRHRLNDWMEQTKDPLLAGKVEAPEGAVVNDPDGISPRETPKKISESPPSKDR